MQRANFGGIGEQYYSPLLYRAREATSSSDDKLLSFFTDVALRKDRPKYRVHNCRYTHLDRPQGVEDFSRLHRRNAASAMEGLAAVMEPVSGWKWHARSVWTASRPSGLPPRFEVDPHLCRYRSSFLVTRLIALLV